MTALSQPLFDIAISKHTDDSGGYQGQILLQGQCEHFYSSSKPFSRDDYLAQWRSAMRRVIEERKISALITDVAVDDYGFGHLWTFPLIPGEVLRGSGFCEAELQSGVFVTQRYFYITAEPENFRKNGAYEGEDEPEALYFFDVHKPERIFAYLDDRIEGISSWFVSNLEMAGSLNRLR